MVKKVTITSVLRHPANMKNTLSCSATCSLHVNYHVKETNMATVWPWRNQASHEYWNVLTTVKVSSREHEWEDIISYCVFLHSQWIRLQHVPNSRPHASYWHHCIPYGIWWRVNFGTLSLSFLRCSLFLLAVTCVLFIEYISRYCRIFITLFYLISHNFYICYPVLLNIITWEIKFR